MLRKAGLVALVTLVAITAAPAGAPVQLSYVYSDSMAPTIGVNDGYVLMPAGQVDTGDIVTFWSPDRDAYVTHRVVERTADGFVTKGDNNHATDQASGYPTVTRDRIVGQVLSVGNGPLVIPGLGVAIGWLRGHRLQVLVGCLGLLALGPALGASTARRSLLRLADIFQPLFAVSLVAIAVLLAFGQPGHEITLVAVDGGAPSEASRVIPVGTENPISVTVHQPARPLTTRVVSTRGLTDVVQTQNASAVSVSGTVPPPSSPGPVPVGVDIRQYPALLPADVLARLQAIHPLLASGACAFLTLSPLWVLYHVLVDPQTPLRSRPVRLLAVLRRGRGGGR
ncbi:signal peptidase I [Haloplanus sp. C73]|uniref:signal peptidase I n=1 Tax=Haloplanus sp. C73 TaxID=3421641 RepID=UPI003EB6A4B2